MYCFLFARGLEDAAAWEVYAITGAVFMAGPIPLILISCLASLYKIRESVERAKTVSSSASLQRSASVTIVVVTAVYLLYNVPVFVNQVPDIFLSFTIQVGND